MGSSLREALLPSRAFRRQPPGVMGSWQLRSHRAAVSWRRRPIALWLTHIPTEVADGVSFRAHEGDTGRRHAKGQASRHVWTPLSEQEKSSGAVWPVVGC